LPVTFGLGTHDQIDRVVIEWPSGQSEEHPRLPAGRAYQIIENKGITEDFDY
jgi:hypothetical protein